MMEILLVDDHYIVRAGIREIIDMTDNMCVQGDAKTGAEALIHIRKRDWSLVLLDFNLPDMTGLELLKIIKEEKPSLPVLMFSSFSESEYAMACLKAGAAGYVTKDANGDVIIKAITQAAAGERYLSPVQKEQLLFGKATTSIEPHERLTCREYDVLIGISRGQSLNEIAQILHLSPKTVSTHRSKILDKMQLMSNADLTKYVMSKNLDKESICRS